MDEDTTQAAWFQLEGEERREMEERHRTQLETLKAINNQTAWWQRGNDERSTR